MVSFTSCRLLFLSTPSARRATRSKPRAKHSGLISIHALREEGDVDGRIVYVLVSISIHALREEGDFLSVIIFYHILSFLSTPSARRATVVGVVELEQMVERFLSTPSARRATWHRLSLAAR